MKLVDISEIKDIAEYERIRDAFRQEVMREKACRRLHVGPIMTFLFENHLTMLYQVQEMMRTERIVKPEAIAHEISTYNALLPSRGGLSATLLIEHEDPITRPQVLSGLRGLEKEICFVVGNTPPVNAVFDLKQIGRDRLSSVQYISFPLQAVQRKAWLTQGQEGNVRLDITHPAYTESLTLSHETLQALAKDFTDDNEVKASRGAHRDAIPRDKPSPKTLQTITR